MIKIKMNRFLCFGLLAMVLAAFISCDKNYMDVYYETPRLNLYQDEINVGTQHFFYMKADCPSAWKLTPGEEWIVPAREHGNNITDSVKVNLVSNRTEAARSGYLYVEAFFKDNYLKDSLLIIQEVTDSSEIIIPTKFKKLNVSQLGDTYTIPVSYNYEVKCTLSEGAEEWIELSPKSFERVGNPLVEKDLVVNVKANNGPKREALLTLETVDGFSEFKIEIPIKQAKNFIPKPAITSFNETFDYIVDDSWIEHENWVITTEDDSRFFYGWVSEDYRAGLLYQYSGYINAYVMISSPINVSGLAKKVFSYTWGPGNSNNHKDGKLEIVASTDYNGDTFKATWNVLKDVTTAEPGYGAPDKNMEVISLNDYSKEQNVYIAFRYTGSEAAYRIDNIKVE